jgi:hypothetical protein
MEQSIVKQSYIFEDYLKDQQLDICDTPHDVIAGLREHFERQKAKLDAFEPKVFKPGTTGGYCYAIAINDGSLLRLTLWIRRALNGECFIMYPRDSEWNPHASYHLGGQYHNKSYGMKSGTQKRQRIDQFKGAEKLGAFYGHGPDGTPICDPDQFTSVLTVPLGILEPLHGCVMVELVEPGKFVSAKRDDLGSLMVTHEEIYRESTPWLVVAIAAQSRLLFDNTFVGDGGLGCLLWATEPPARRVRFSIGHTILIENLGSGNPVFEDRNITLCENARPRIEAACRRASYERPGDRVELKALDFQ